MAQEQALSGGLSKPGQNRLIYFLFLLNSVCGVFPKEELCGDLFVSSQSRFFPKKTLTYSAVSFERNKIILSVRMIYNYYTGRGRTFSIVKAQE